jgi:hypothetical protein
MPKASPIISSFNAGELAPSLDGRVDFQKYNSGCKKLENFFPMVQGAARRRSGTRIVEEVKNSTNRTWLLRFEFSEDQAYILEFGDQYIRFYTNHGQVLSGGVPYEISSPYAVGDLTSAQGTFRLKTVQSGDIIYIAHPDFAPRKLSRFGATNWTLTTVDFTGGPFKDINPDETRTVYASAKTGNITLTASAATFAPTDVGSLFLMEKNTTNDPVLAWEPGKSVSVGNLRKVGDRNYYCTDAGTTGTATPLHTKGTAWDGSAVQWRFEDAGFGIVRITKYTSSTQVSATVIKQLPGGVVTASYATNRWAFSKWSSVDGWPDNVTFFRERLVFSRGQEIDMSVAADFENFADRNDGNEVVADQAIAIQITSDTVNNVLWMMPADGLVLGTAGGEFVCEEQSKDDPLGPDNVKITVQSLYGSRGVQPVQIGDSVIFVQKAGRKVREIKYDFGSDGYKSKDLSVLAEHITYGGVVSMAYQQEPHSIVWCVRADGVLLGLTFNEEQEVIGWHRHITDGVVECVAAIPCPDGTQDDLWMIVRRTINGQQKRYIEYMEQDFTDEDDITDAFFVDCGATYDGAATDTITGLDHLEGKEVAVLADGAVHPNRTVSGGAISLQREATKAQVGLPYTSTLTTMRLEAGAGDGTAQGKTKRITKAVIRFLDTLGGKAGPNVGTLDTLQFRSSADPMDAPPALFTGDKMIEWPSGYDFDGFMTIQQDQALPMTVLAIMPQVHTQDR